MRASRWISTFASLRSQGVFGSFVGAVVMSLAAVFLLAASAPAADLTWDQGSGNWDTTTANWTGSTWTDGNTAVFGGTASSTITLTQPVSATGLTFNVTGDTISGAPSLTFSGGHTIAVGSGLAATVGAPIAGTEGLQVQGGGTLTRSTAATDTYTGGTTVSGTGTVLSYTATLSGTTSAPALSDGNIVVNAGQLKLGASSTTQDLYFGTTSTARSITVSNGGSIGSGTLTLGTGNAGSFRSFYVGNGATSNGNSVLVTGANSFISGNGVNDSRFAIGLDSSNNTLNIEAGAAFGAQKASGTNYFNIGQNAGANGNVVTVTGTGSKLFGSTMPLYVGVSGNNNGLAVGTGGYFKMQRVYMGSVAGASAGKNNYVTITGDGTTRSAAGYISATSNSVLSVGESSGATGNTFTVSNGGTFVFEGTSNSKRLGVGVVAGASSNSITVTGVNSSININHAISLGVGVDTAASNALGGDSNSLNVYDGATLVSTGGVVVGNTATGGSVKIGNGAANTAAVTLGASFAQYTASAGTVPPTGGSAASAFPAATASNVWVNLLSSGTTLAFNNGRLTTGDSVFTGSTLVGGNGTINFDGPAYIGVTSGTQTISPLISGVGGLTKEGAGLLELSNIGNAYAGNTSVLAGTLKITTAGTPWLSDLANVSVASGAVLNLNFTGADTISALYLGGVQVTQAGTWGATGSGATNINDTYFTGSGTLNVTSAVPEPETLGMLGAGLALAGFLHRRRRRA